MENPIISVIIPVYNAEQHLRQCIDSVLSQTLTEIEILCIDDASTDGSPGILAEYAKRDDRVKVITNITNLKADASRNLAIDAARGEFICFIDSDDFLPDPGMFASLAELARHENLDLVMFQARHFIEEGSSEILSAAFQNNTRQGAFEDDQCGKVMSGGELLDLALKFGNYRCYIWMRLYRTSLVRGTGLRFLEGGNVADRLFTPLAMLLAKRACAVDHVYYMRRIHERSVTTSALVDPEALRKLFLEAKEILFKWKSEKTQSIIAASGSRSANDLVNRQLRYLGRLFTQFSDDAAQRELDAFEKTPDNQLITTHLILIRQLSGRVEKLRRSVEKLRESVEKQRESANKRKESVEKLKAKVKKLKKTCKLRGKRPNSIRACVKFMLRRLVGRK